MQQGELCRQLKQGIKKKNRKVKTSFIFNYIFNVMFTLDALDPQPLKSRPKQDHHTSRKPGKCFKGAAGTLHEKKEVMGF